MLPLFLQNHAQLAAGLGVLAALLVWLRVQERAAGRFIAHRLGWRGVLLTGWLGAGLGFALFGHFGQYPYSDYIIPAFCLGCVGGIIGAIAGAAREIAAGKNRTS